MTRIHWWLVRQVSRILEPAERDAVWGDVLESGETAAQALGDVSGLVIRRQTALWRDARPWLVLVGLVVPLALLLSLVSRRVSEGNAVYAWMYFSNWDWRLFQERAFWLILADTSTIVVPDILVLLSLAWTIGILLGAASRRTIAVNGALFAVVLLFGVFAAVPWYTQLQIRTLENAGHVFPGDGAGRVIQRHSGDAAGPSLMFYVLLFQIFLVLLPAFWGMHKGLGRAARPWLLGTIPWIPAVAAMVLLAGMQGVWWAGLATHNWIWLRSGWRMPPLLFVLAGPVAYMLVSGAWQRWHREYKEIEK